MLILGTTCTQLTALLLFVALRVTIAAPVDEPTEMNFGDIFNIPEYDDTDEFLPPNETSFDPFDWRLCQILHKKEPGSLVVSPVSLKLVLAMVYEGAADNTAIQLRSALNLPTSRLESRNKFHKIIESLETKKQEFVLDVASKMFIRKDVTAQSRYSKILRLFYNAELENEDFSQSRKAVQDMNDWVSKATHGHIKSMFDEGVVTSSTMLLLLNAIYFKGLWKYSFNSNYTAPGKFHITSTRGVTVPFMNMTQHLYFSESVQLDSKILRLPYKGKKYSMFVVLPNKVDGLENLIQTVNPFLLRKHMFLMEDVKVNVMIPKFNMEFTTELEDVLQEMGIQDMFNADEASFPGIVQNQSVFVSKFIQKSALEVNEEGTEASVSTGVTFDDRIGGELVDFHANHPFLFFIQDETTGTVIFVGKVVDPSNSETTLRTPDQSEGLQTRHGDDEVPKSKKRNEISHKIVPQSENEYPILMQQPANEVVQNAYNLESETVKETQQGSSKSPAQRIAEIAAKAEPQTAAKLYKLLESIYNTQTAIIRNI